MKLIQCFRLRTRKKDGSKYLYSQCIECERQQTKEHQKINVDYWKSLNSKSYYKCSEGKVKRRVLNRSIEERAERARLKSSTRCTRAKLARFRDELTELVSKEAHDLRLLRNKLTGIKWHVDHIIPLKHDLVCGLHIWNNLQVIPARTNMSKSNKFAQGDYYSLYEKWKT